VTSVNQRPAGPELPCARRAASPGVDVVDLRGDELEDAVRRLAETPGGRPTCSPPPTAATR
jgi:hypothetical protein